MASPATASFLAAWRKQGPRPALLVKVELTDPSTQTLYLSNLSITTPGGQYWEPAIQDCEPIEAPGSFLSTGPDLCSTAFWIFNRRFAYQTAGDVAAHSFIDFRWVGATVTFYLWEQNLTDFANAFQVFKGVVQDYEPDESLIRVMVAQRNDWNQTIAPSFVNKRDYPRAPEASIGLPLPIYFGKGHARPMRGDWAGTIGASRDKFDRAGGAIPSIAGIMVDMGAGGSGDKAKVILSSHNLDMFDDQTAGGNIFLKTLTEHPGIWNPAGGDTFQGASNGPAGFTIPDEFDQAFYILVPTEVNVPASNAASEPRHATDIGNELTYALLDYDATKRNLELPLMAITPPGEYVDARLVLGYRTVGGNTGLRLIFRNNDGPSERTDTIAASTTPTTMYGGSIAGHEPADPWDFSRCEVRVNFDGGVGTGVKCHVFFVALEIQYKPRRELLRMAKRVETRTTKFGLPTPRRNRIKNPAAPIVSPQYNVEVEYPVTQFEGDFFANVNGQRDDGSGTYTGSSFAVIERAQDILRYLLQEYLGQSLGQIEVASGIHGDLHLMDTPLGTWNNRNMVYFVRIDKEQTGEEIIQSLARDSLSWISISPFTDRFHQTCWKPGNGTLYDVTLEPAHLVGEKFLKVRTTPKSRVTTGIRLRYLWDAFRKLLAGDTFAAHDRSGSGYNYDNIRDQYLSVVTGVNDKLDFKIGGTTNAATLAAGDYTDATFLSELQFAMSFASADALSVGFGGRIVTGVNDALAFNDGSARNVALAAGLYTMEGLAIEVAAKMNSVSSNWSCSYSRTTKKFTISRSAGTAQLAFSGASYVECVATLGFDKLSYTGLSSYTSAREVEEERIVICTTSAGLSLLFETGANGLNGTRDDCAELMGYSNLRDLTGANGYTAPCPKGNREQALLLAKERYGGQRVVPIDADTIMDTDTAREWRNRYIDLTVEPRLVVEFETVQAPDLERARRIQFSSAFDAILPFPKEGSNGSWAGKSFWVLQTRQHAVRRWITEVMCVEAD